MSASIINLENENSVVLWLHVADSAANSLTILEDSDNIDLVLGNILAVDFKINDALDIDITDLSDRDTLIYDESRELWVAQPPIEKIVYRKYNFSSPSLQWLVNHNLNTYDYSVTLRDQYRTVFIAKTQTIDENNFIVDLSSAIGGTADVIFNVST